MTIRRAPIDAFLLVLILALSGMGLVMLFSSSSIMAEQRYGDAYFFFRPQLRHMVLGFIIMLAASRVPYQFLMKLAYPILIMTLILLAMVIVPGIGHKVGGASRWLRLPGVSIQPSEMAKLAIVIYMAYSLSRKGEKTGSFFYGFVPHLIVLGATIPLILAEPDLGTAVCIVVIAFAMMFVAGTKIWHIAALGLAAMPLLYYQIVNYSFRLKRITAFIDPWSDPSGAGYHIIHSFYAFAAGGLWGQGPGAGQQKLFFLPEPHTDFIFSVVAEELGLAGVLIIAILFLLLVYRGLKIAMTAVDYCGVYLALGCTMVVGLPAFFNMAVVTALLPTKGLPLPFFSYGGTNLLVCFAAMGILLNVAGQSRAAAPAKTARPRSGAAQHQPALAGAQL
ncbi:putative lipid II flippase FtsW [Deltaproteobacteria bacterium Smac51]|nr:putative lipid II flippase FtsW [Deltaproteobacteria bacterium Smac51]